MRSLLPVLATALACGVAVAGPVPANPQAPAVTQRSGAPWVNPGQGAPHRDASNIGRTDRNFIADAARAGLAEIAAGQLALQRSRAPGIREYAEVLVKDHQAANARLQQIAAAKEATRAALSLPLDDGLKLETALFQLCFSSADKVEGVSAFLEKRTAEFTGR